MRKPGAFRQSDVTKAVKAVVRAGVEVARVEVANDRRIVVIAGAARGDKDSSEWDSI